MNIYVWLLRSSDELFKVSVKLFCATLSFILALKRLLGSSLEAASGSVAAHNHSTNSPWIVTLELLKTSLRLSWSPLGAPETSITSKSDAQSSFGKVFLRF